MLNFAEQTGSGAVMLVWSFLRRCDAEIFMYPVPLLPHTAWIQPFHATLFTPSQPEQCDHHGACLFQSPQNMTQQHPRSAHGRDMTRTAQTRLLQLLKLGYFNCSNWAAVEFLNLFKPSTFFGSVQFE